MALFENSKGIYLWMFWVLAFLAIIALSMFLSTLARKSTRAVMLGLLM
jgi:ABC-type transport system involved in multi-copper enzyme maturation permease subunit